MSFEHASARTSPRSTVSLLSRGVVWRFALATGASALVLHSVVAVLCLRDAAHQRTILERECAHSIALERSFLSQDFEAVGADVRHLAGQDLLRRFLSGDDSVRTALETEYALFIRAKPIYDQVRCLDLSGQERIRINLRDGDAEVVPVEELQSKARRYYFEQAVTLEPGEVLVSRFDLNVEHGVIQTPFRPVVRFVTPVSDLSGEKKGILVLNYLGARLLAKLREIDAGFRGESLLVNGDGYYLQAPDPSLEWGWIEGRAGSFREDHPAAWTRSRSLDSEQFFIGDDLFTIERFVPSRHLLRGAREAARDDPGSLLLVSLVSGVSSRAGPGTLCRQLLVISGGTMLLVAVLSLYWARSAATRELQDRRLAESEARLRLLSSRLLRAQEDERRSLSRQLHDELGQLVTAVRLDVKSATRHAVEEPAASRLEKAIESLDALLGSLHEIASRLRPCVLDDLGLEEAIESFISKYEQQTGIVVRAELHLRGTPVPAIIGENVYRILQEALTNVARHTESRQVQVLLEADETSLVLCVEDRGVGFDPEASSTTRLGILGMRERVELLDGEFELRSAPGEGTALRVVIPLARSGGELT